MLNLNSRLPWDVNALNIFCKKHFTSSLSLFYKQGNYFLSEPKDQAG